MSQTAENQSIQYFSNFLDFFLFFFILWKDKEDNAWKAIQHNETLVYEYITTWKGRAQFDKNFKLIGVIVGTLHFFHEFNNQSL